MKKNILNVILLSTLLIIFSTLEYSCMRAQKQAANDKKITTIFQKLSNQKLNSIIKTLESKKTKERMVKIQGQWLNTKQALDIAYKRKGTFHKEIWNKLEYRDFVSFSRPLTFTHLRDLELPPLYSPESYPPSGPCSPNPALTLVLLTVSDHLT